MVGLCNILIVINLSYIYSQFAQKIFSNDLITCPAFVCTKRGTPYTPYLSLMSLKSLKTQRRKNDAKNAKDVLCFLNF